jgi:hypothetical protein
MLNAFIEAQVVLTLVAVVVAFATYFIESNNH